MLFVFVSSSFHAHHSVSLCSVIESLVRLHCLQSFCDSPVCRKKSDLVFLLLISPFSPRLHILSSFLLTLSPPNSFSLLPSVVTGISPLFLLITYTACVCVDQLINCVIPVFVLAIPEYQPDLFASSLFLSHRLPATPTQSSRLLPRSNLSCSCVASSLSDALLSSRGEIPN